jgi:hypothetical protein
MRFYVLLTAMLFAVQLNAQDVKGYYITKSGQTVKGFFEYGDLNNTSSLKFKSSNKDVYKAIPQDATEYGTDEENVRFERHVVKIDVSDASSTDSNPQWDTQTIFLNVVVKGNATLYSYTKNYQTKFFYTIGKQSEVNQLVYKKYINANGVPAENFAFRQQLYKNVSCKGQDVSEFSELPYHEKQLEEVFINFNKCSGSESETFGPKRDTGVSYSFIAGIYNLNFGLMDIAPVPDRENNITYGFGAEAAYTFRSEKISLFAGLEYELMSTDLEYSYKQSFNTVHKKFEIDANALNFYFGPRYNFLLNDNHKIFFDIAPGISIPFGNIKENTVISAESGDSYVGEITEHKLKAGFYFNIDLGYTFDERYSVAVRYETRRDFLNDVYSTYKTDITRWGITLRYTLK